LEPISNNKSNKIAASIAIQDEFLTVEELAALLKITKMTVYRMVKRGDLPHYQIGRIKRFRKRDIEVYLQQCRTPTNA